MYCRMISETINQTIHALESKLDNLYARLLCEVPVPLSELKHFLVAELVW